MHHVTNDRLSCSAAALILILVKKDKTAMTPAQLYALELAARRERNRAIARLLKAGARALKSAIARALHAFKLKGMRHA